MISLLALFLLQSPVITSACSYDCRITYTITNKPKHGDAQVCSDATLTHCGNSAVVSHPISDELNPQGGRANVWVKAGKVSGKYLVSITMGKSGNPQGTVPVWVRAAATAPTVPAPSKHWWWPF